MTTTGTPAWLATRNDRAALRLLLAHGPLSRSQLGTLSGMSKPTAGQMITRLERVGLISPAGAVTGARGPNAVSYGVRVDSLTGVAISILDDRIEAVLVDPVDRVHPVVVQPLPTGKRSPGSDVERAIDAAVRASGLVRESVGIVAVGVQAAFDDVADRLSLTDSLPGWPEHGARAQIEARTGLAVILENDVNLATLAEVADTGADDFAYLWLGVGLGAGLFSGGSLRRGAAGASGEIGYLEVPRSAGAMDPDAGDFTDLLGEPALRKLLNAPDLASALVKLPGEPLALEALAARIALLVEPLVAVADPALVILGGPTGMVGGDLLADLTQAQLAARGRRVHVRTGRAGANPVLLGLRRMLVDSIRKRLEDAIDASTGKEN